MHGNRDRLRLGEGDWPEGHEEKVAIHQGKKDWNQGKKDWEDKIMFARLCFAFGVVDIDWRYGVEEKWLMVCSGMVMFWLLFLICLVVRWLLEKALV